MSFPLWHLDENTYGMTRGWFQDYFFIIFFKWGGTGGTKNQSRGAHGKLENSIRKKYSPANWLSKKIEHNFQALVLCPVPLYMWCYFKSGTDSTPAPWRGGGVDSNYIFESHLSILREAGVQHVQHETDRTESEDRHRFKIETGILVPAQGRFNRHPMQP